MSALPTHTVRKCDKVISDAVHGMVHLHPLLVSVVDTPVFQRLRDIKQLGAVPFVFPSASHSRFEHSIGVCHLAGKVMTHLRLNQPELGITLLDVLTVQLAALCHDLGHGPFSHLFDHMVVPSVLHKDDPTYDHNSKDRIEKNGKGKGKGERVEREERCVPWCHEHASLLLMDVVWTDPGVQASAARYGLTREHLHAAQQMIVGKQKNAPAYFVWTRVPPHRRFMHEIVSNSFTGLDVDRLDYLARDTNRLGDAFRPGFDMDRLIHVMRVLPVASPATGVTEYRLAYHHKEAWNLYELLHTRYTMFKRCYMHPVVKYIEHEVGRCLTKAAPHIHLRGKSVSDILGRVVQASRVAHTHRDTHAVEDYAALTDSLLFAIEHARHADLHAAQGILSAIRHRRLAKHVGTLSFASDSDMDAVLLRGMICDMIQVPPQVVLVLPVIMNYGLGDCDPVQNAVLYTREHDTGRYAQATVPREAVSRMLTHVFEEKMYYVYHRPAPAADPVATRLTRTALETACRVFHPTD